MDAHLTDSPLGKRSGAGHGQQTGSNPIPLTINGNRTSTDLSTAFESPLTAKVRPTSEIFLQTPYRTNTMEDSIDRAAEQWLADLETYQLTLQQMADVRLDKNFKEELSAIEQWFQVLSEAERTAALFALLQQTTPIQIRFFITVLQKLANNDPLSAVLSPTNHERELLQNQLNEAIIWQQQQQQQQQLSPGKLGNGLLQPDVMVNIESTGSGLSYLQKHQASGNGNGPANPNNAAFMTPSKDMYSTSAANSSFLSSFQRPIIPPVTPWTQEISRPKSATDVAPSSSSSLRNQVPASPPQYGPGSGQASGSARRRLSKQSMHGHNRSLSHMDEAISSPMPIHGASASGPGTTISSSYLPDGHTSWASMTNTPLSNNGGTPRDKINHEILSTTAMKMAALSTVNGRAQLDNDIKKYRRHGSVITDEDQKFIEKEFMTMAGGSSQNNGNTNASTNNNGTPSWTPYGNRAGQNSPDGKNTGTGSTSRPTSQWYSLGDQMAMDTPIRTRASAVRAQASTQASPALSMVGTSSKKESNYLDPKLLQDVGAWLRVLRLHKYTENLSDLPWQELVELGDKQLEERGVNALGARRKMLKVFEQIKEAQEDGTLEEEQAS